MSFIDKKTLSVAEAVKNILSKKPDPNDINDPRNFNAKDPKMLDMINTNLKNIEATKKANDVAHSFGKSPEEPKSIPYMPDYKRVSNREISGPITRKKPAVAEAVTQSGTVMRNASNVLRTAQNASQDRPSTEKQRLGLKYYEKKSYPNSSSQPKPATSPNQDKVDAANRVQSAQRTTVMSSPSAKDSEDSQSAKRDVISSAMRKQQDMERHKELAKDTDNNTSTDKDTTAPDDDINKAVKQAKEPKQDFEQDVKEIDVTDKNKSKKTNEEKQMTTFRDAAIKALYETKKKADKDYDQDGKVESPKDEVWGSRLRAAKMAGKLKEELKGNQHKIDANKNGKVDAEDFKLLRAKKDMKKEEVEELDEAFPTVADGEKSLKAKEGKTTHGKITKTKTGMKHERDYDDQKEPEVKRGRGRPKKRLSEMRQEYFNYVEEEVDNETFTKEIKDQQAKFAGKKKGADVAKASVQAVKQEEVEQIDELSKKTLASYIKKANARQTDDYHDAGSMDVEPERRDGIARTEKIHRAVDKLVSKKTNEEVEQIDEISKETAGKYLTAPQGKGANKYKVSSDKSVYPDIATMSKHSTNVRRALKRSGDSSLYKKPDYYKEENEQMDEVAPPGREDQVKALKKVPGIDNPWAVSWASYRKSHPKKSKD